MMKQFTSKRIFVGLFCILICSCFAFSFAVASNENANCPCQGSINDLKYYYENDPKFRNLLTSAFKNMQHLPAEYPDDNPWLCKNFSHLVEFLTDWCTFLPTIDGSHDDGLKYIQEFAWFYYHNEYGVRFVQETPGREIMQRFARERGKFMDSKASTGKIADWIKDPRVEIGDYLLPDPKAPNYGFKSFNEFFTRTLKDQAKSRPQTMPDRDYIISAPTDCIMNSIPQRITDITTLLQTKFNQALNIVDMLKGYPHAKRFIGGTALSCVLMPNTYHYYHSPVNGDVVFSKIVEDAFYGYDNFPAWAPPNGNVGYYGTEFNQFENFQRGYFVVDTKKYGYVALVAVGLNTISSIVFEEKFKNIDEPVPVKRGEMLGHFRYGGSLFIMIFEPNRYKSDAIQVRLGNQIGLFDTKSDIPSPCE